MPFCHNCGNVLEEPGAFCSACGAPLEPEAAQVAQSAPRPTSQQVFFSTTAKVILAFSVLAALVGAGFLLFGSRLARLNSVMVPARSIKVATEAQGGVADVVRRSSDAVVLIVISDSSGHETALGSGFLISADGEIVTNYHVIKEAHSATVKLANGAFFPVTGVLASDADKDLAILKVGGKNLPFLQLGDVNSLHVGDHVVAIGSPLGLEGTASDGIVSALRDADRMQWIQTTAPVSHGNSGGPLLDLNDRVVGVITWGVPLGQNLNFAAPSIEVKALLVLAQQKAKPLASVGSENESTLARGTVSASSKKRPIPIRVDEVTVVPTPDGRHNLQMVKAAFPLNAIGKPDVPVWLMCNDVDATCYPLRPGQVYWGTAINPGEKGFSSCYPADNSSSFCTQIHGQYGGEEKLVVYIMGIAKGEQQ